MFLPPVKNRGASSLLKGRPARHGRVIDNGFEPSPFFNGLLKS
jgi:hypothetical protein